MTVTVHKQPLNGRASVTTSAELLTQIVKSGTNTTFTNRQVIDGDGWDLSNVAAGHTLKVIDGDDEYRAQIDSVDNGSDTITIKGWTKGGISGAKLATMKPTDGVRVYVLKTDRCKNLIVDALDANTADAFLGFESTVTVATGHPIAYGAAQANHRLTLEAGLAEVIDLGNTWVIAGSAQELSWIAM